MKREQSQETMWCRIEEYSGGEGTVTLENTHYIHLDVPAAYSLRHVAFISVNLPDTGEINYTH